MLSNSKYFSYICFLFSFSYNPAETPCLQENIAAAPLARIQNLLLILGKHHDPTDPEPSFLAVGKERTEPVQTDSLK